MNVDILIIILKYKKGVSCMENRYDKDYKDNEINNYYEINELGFKKEIINLGIVTDTLCKLVNQSRKILKDNLVGIYLHGSAVMGCFNPQKSDIDLIIVVKDTMSDKAKRAYMDMIIELK